MADESIEGVFREPFKEQVAFFRQKLGNQVPTERWTDLQKDAHDKAFMVAGATKAELLSDLAAAVEKAISQGITLKDFRKDFQSIVEIRKWNYKGEFNWRTRVIYSTNLATSYAAGRLAQLQEFEYWAYKHSGAAHPRLDHKAWHNKVLPAAHPWWKTHYPPNGWGCGCRAVGYSSVDDAEMQGGKLDPNPDNSIDPNTGLPVGVGKGWDYMPGQTVADTVRAMAEQTQQWQYRLAKAYMEDLPTRIKDPFSRSYRELPSTGVAARQYAKRIIESRDNYQEYQTLGLLESRDVEHIKKAVFKDERNPNIVYSDINASDFDFTLNASGVGHVQVKHGPPGVNAKSRRIGEWQTDHRPVEPEDYEQIPKILNDPDTIKTGRLTDRQKLPAITYTKTIAGETYILTMEILTGKRSVNVHSMAIKRKKGADGWGGT